MNEQFFFVTCQSGMESVVKANIAKNLSDSKFAFSKPGFLTYKVEGSADQLMILSETLGVRSWGHSILGIREEEPDWQSLAKEMKIQFPSIDSAERNLNRSKKKSGSPLRTFELLEFLKQGDFFSILESTNRLTERLIEATSFAKDNPLDEFHIWFRDGLLPAGLFRTDKEETPELKGLTEFCSQLCERLIKEGILSPNTTVNTIAKKGRRVLDLCFISPTHWWCGHHEVATKPQRWAGGVMPIPEKQQQPVSRAYYKAREAFAWAGLPAKKGDKCAEIGSSPGGSCQWLLQQGLKVTGIDPAEMAPEVMSHPNFRHVRRRGSEVKRSDLAGIRWLLSDANIHPDLVLDTVESLVGHPAINPEALILTIKPPKTDMLKNPERYVERVRSLGYSDISVRQLVFNRQEFCLVAKR